MEPSSPNFSWGDKEPRQAVTDFENRIGPVEDPFVRVVDSYYATLSLENDLLDMLNYVKDKDDFTTDKTVHNIVRLNAHIGNTFDELVDRIMDETESIEERAALIAGLFAVADTAQTPAIAILGGRLPSTIYDFDALKVVIEREYNKCTTTKAFKEDVKEKFAQFNGGLIGEVKYLYDYDTPDF